MFVDFFIKRPVFALVCSIIITLAGLMAIPTLPIAQYPDLAPPTVSVSSTYVGASSDVVESAVTIPLEQELNGVEGMKYMTSTSGNDGVSNITITFEPTRDLDVAAVDEDLDRLTEREREVMRLIARGYAYKEVAKELFISIKTVETHMSNVLRKLQLSSRHELTRWASDRRLL